MPMIYYGGSGEELAMDPNVGAPAQPLVRCPEEGDEVYPCDIVVTRAEDAVGIWMQYVSRPDLMAPEGMGYHRVNPDGSFVIADAPENTAAPFGNYPFGTSTFNVGEVRLSVTCRRCARRPLNASTPTATRRSPWPASSRPYTTNARPGCRTRACRASG